MPLGRNNSFSFAGSRGPFCSVASTWSVSVSMAWANSTSRRAACCERPSSEAICACCVAACGLFLRLIHQQLDHLLLRLDLLFQNLDSFGNGSSGWAAPAA